MFHVMLLVILTFYSFHRGAFGLADLLKHRVRLISIPV